MILDNSEKNKDWTEPSEPAWYSKTHRKPSPDTLRRWTLEVLKGSDINAPICSAHSTHHACASKNFAKVYLLKRYYVNEGEKWHYFPEILSSPYCAR